jgi:hypothetical protein
MIDEDISYLCRQGIDYPNWFANSIVFISLNQNLNGKGVLSLKGEVFDSLIKMVLLWLFCKNSINLELVWLKNAFKFNWPIGWSVDTKWQIFFFKQNFYRKKR